jgi:hypothetical protein
MTGRRWEGSVKRGTHGGPQGLRVEVEGGAVAQSVERAVEHAHNVRRLVVDDHARLMSECVRLHEGARTFSSQSTGTVNLLVQPQAS